MSATFREARQEVVYDVAGEQPLTRDFLHYTIDADIIKIVIVDEASTSTAGPAQPRRLDLVFAAGPQYNANGKLGKKRNTVQWVEDFDCPAFVQELLRKNNVWFREDDEQ